jgi:drug/metabolite transporter (DMT)-like permease
MLYNIMGRTLLLQLAGCVSAQIMIHFAHKPYPSLAQSWDRLLFSVLLCTGIGFLATSVVTFFIAWRGKYHSNPRYEVVSLAINGDGDDD